MAELSGWRNGLLNELLLTLPTEGSWDEALAQAEGKLDEKKNGFGRGAQLTLDFGSRPVPGDALEALVNHIKTRYSLLTVAVVATDMATQEAARRMALGAYLMPPGTSAGLVQEEPSGSNALYLPHTVRSGQRIVHNGSVIVAGDVNAGAEVIAKGDILIFGTLRGLAHAGSQGDESARILAGNMRPQQLRIAGHIARAPEESGSAAPTTRQPEVARIESGAIQVSLV